MDPEELNTSDLKDDWHEPPEIIISTEVPGLLTEEELWDNMHIAVQKSVPEGHMIVQKFNQDEKIGRAIEVTRKDFPDLWHDLEEEAALERATDKLFPRNLPPSET